MAIRKLDHFFKNTTPDSFKNNFKIIFNVVPSALTILKSLSDKLEYRIQNVNIPAIALSKYDVSYLGEKIQRVGSELEYTRELTFNLRIDRIWEVYRGFAEWRNKILSLDGSTQAIDSKDSNLRIDITIDPIDRNAVAAYSSKIKWDFKGCLITGMQELEFNHEAGDVNVVQITLSFIEMKDFV